MEEEEEEEEEEHRNGMSTGAADGRTDGRTVRCVDRSFVAGRRHDNERLDDVGDE